MTNAHARANRAAVSDWKVTWLFPCRVCQRWWVREHGRLCVLCKREEATR